MTISRPWVQFAQLENGERFQFVYNPLSPTAAYTSVVTYQKISRYTYSDGTGNTFFTGLTTAVLPERKG